MLYKFLCPDQSSGGLEISEPSWIFAIEEAKLAESGIEAVFPKGLPVLLIKKEGNVYAISNRCAHMGCTLAGGAIDGFILTCPCHNWKYDIRTGQFLSASEIRIHSYQLKISDGKIFIRIEGR